MRKWRKKRIEEILVNNSSLVSGLSEASGLEESENFNNNKSGNIGLLKAYLRPLKGLVTGSRVTGADPT